MPRNRGQGGGHGQARERQPGDARRDSIQHRVGSGGRPGISGFAGADEDIGELHLRNGHLREGALVVRTRDEAALFE